MNTIVVRGIVLSNMPIGEYDKRIVLLTKEFGKITAFARGARRMNSPYMAGTRPFSFGEFTLYPGRDSYSVNGIKIENYFEDLSKDFETTCLAMYFMELSAYYARENVDGSDMINLIYATFKALLNTAIPNELVRRIFELKTLVINGEYPEMFSCVKCGSKEELEGFSTSANGMICKKCGGQSGTGEEGLDGFGTSANGMICEKSGKSLGKSDKLDPSTVYTLQYIISSEIGKLFTFNVSKDVLSQLSNVVGEYLKSKVDTKFKSLEMLWENI